MTGTNFSSGKSSHDYPRSLPVSEWPELEVFVHISAARGFASLAAGQRVEYQIGINPKTGRRCAAPGVCPALQLGSKPGKRNRKIAQTI
jgi:hypothetical protein